MSFRSPRRLLPDARYDVRLPRGLMLRLLPERPIGWRIKVTPAQADSVNYIWPVSPPYRFAPQLLIGAAYNLTAVQSARLPRELNFVTTAGDYDRASARVTKLLAGGEDDTTAQRITTGTLWLRVTGFRTRSARSMDGDSMRALAWVTVRGKACVPK